MTASNNRDDVADLMGAYEAPPPRPDFVEHLRAGLETELEAALTARRRLVRLWAYVGVAAAAVLAVGIGWALLHNGGEGAGAPAPTGANPPVALGTPRRIPFSLPNAQYACTPRAVPKGPHIEAYSITREQPPVFVPATADNLARDMTVSSSDPWPIIGAVEQVTDGQKQGWDTDLLELAPGLQWVQIDLGQSAAIHAIVVWHYVPSLRVYHDVIIQVSDDAGFRTGVTTVYNNDYDNSSGLGMGDDMEYVEDYRGRIFETNGVRSRYVRLWSRGNIDNDQNHYVEVEVYGEPVEALDGQPASVELKVGLPPPLAD